MGGYVRRSTSFACTWLAVLRIYLRVGWLFIGWRLHMWRQRSHPLESTNRSMKQTLLLIRHGQTTWNAEHRLPGQLPGIALNDKGRQQVARLADALAVLPVSSIISSPLERARETAEILAQTWKLPIQLERDLMDTDVGSWAGQNYDEISKNDAEWKAYVHDPTTAPPGIETFTQVQQRALAAVERWRRQDSIGPFPAFVAHADVVKLIVAHYSGLDTARAGSLFIDNASVSMVEIDPENIHSPRVIAIGWSPRPGWLQPPITQEQKNQGALAVQDKTEQKE